jgi:hypothetical protein
MDIFKAQEIAELAKKQTDLAWQYAQTRETATKAKTEMELRLISRLSTIRTQKANVGIDMSFLMLMELEPDTKTIYKEWKEAEAKYKGLEKILEANASIIMFYQSLMRYQKDGEKWG